MAKLELRAYFVLNNSILTKYYFKKFISLLVFY